MSDAEERLPEGCGRDRRGMRTDGAGRWLWWRRGYGNLRPAPASNGPAVPGLDAMGYEIVRHASMAASSHQHAAMAREDRKLPSLDRLR